MSKTVLSPSTPVLGSGIGIKHLVTGALTILKRNGSDGTVINIDRRGVTVIGSDSNSTVRLPRLGIHPRHAEIRLTPKGLSLINCTDDSNSVLVNGCVLVTKTRILRDGDIITIAGKSFRYDCISNSPNTRNRVRRSLDFCDEEVATNFCNDKENKDENETKRLENEVITLDNLWRSTEKEAMASQRKCDALAAETQRANQALHQLKLRYSELEARLQEHTGMITLPTMSAPTLPPSDTIFPSHLRDQIDRIWTSGLLRVRIAAPTTRSSTQSSGSVFILYEIIVNVSGSSYSVFRRFSQFKAMHNAIVKILQHSDDMSAKIPIFPPSTILSAPVNSFFVEKRLTDLRNYVSELFMVKECIISDPAIEFLNLSTACQLLATCPACPSNNRLSISGYATHEFSSSNRSSGIYNRVSLSNSSATNSPLLII